uniref:Uncharacterized protein AlNc14C103G6130 n=1 Tax=Albugo laibachii Nc14 TaxID=890382 RepID=F0WHS3_9STRA|nr:conserved hypothetical protein [Albugo laibachii Nc14]|eukprot:CCA20798.1 conserved hypothetical protein [Albugo laibachii Nc14]
MLRQLCALRPQTNGLWRLATRSCATAASETIANQCENRFTVVKHPVPESDTSNAYFAVIKLSGTQYKVTEGDVVITEKLEAKVGSHLDLDEVRATLY